MSKIMRWQRVGLILIDAMLVSLALFAAYYLRLYFGQELISDFVQASFRGMPNSELSRIGVAWLQLYDSQFLAVLPVFIVVRLLGFWHFNLYRGILRYASTSELVAIVLSATAGTVLLAVLNFIVVRFIPAFPGLPEHGGHLARVPVSVIGIEYVLTMLLVGGGRFSRRILVSHILHRPDTGDLRRVLIVGAGDAGEAAARQMRHSPVKAYIPVAFVDDDAGKQGRTIHGVPVTGSIRDIPRAIEKHSVEEVLIALRSTPARLREIVELCEDARVSFKILPSMHDVLTGRVSINQMRPVEIEDLLGRDEVRFELGDEQNYIRNKTIMITGAGGSIGSELCRQLVRFEPRRILLFGHGENSIYEIANELNFECKSRCTQAIIGDVRDWTKVEHVVREYKPEIFFHAAAHKHVPLMEAHPDEAIKNNVIGTLNIAKAAELVNAEKFILISSDKAVRPTNIMGASKRVAEMIIFCLARTSRTQFVAVRFGNVLGSRGSVIPLFKRQIAQGGPVTITHPDIVRFFMTIPEAVSLVIQAGSMKEQRRLFLLDMGAPVRIVDLARNLIRLSGFEPDKDIPINFTGLRPGEKLKEELLTEGENVNATGIGKIFMTEPDDVDCEQLWKDVEELRSLAESIDATAVKEKMKMLVPDYIEEQVS